MSEDLSPQDRVAQRYRVDDLVHRRPYANVYNVTRDGDSTSRFTAWQLRGIFALSPEGIRRFSDALGQVRAISTAAIVRVVDHEVLPNGPVIITETVRSPTLRERLLRSHRLPRPEVIQVVRAVASVLDELHGRDPPLVHRALSPEEIHIDASNCVVQACGFVYAVGASGMLRGTRTGFAEPSYRVPEALADTLDPRADLFSLASIVFECLTGDRAFAGDDPVAVANALRREPRPSARALRAEIPVEVDTILHRAWSTDLKTAYPTAWSFARDLTAALGPLTEASPVPVASAAAIPLTRRAAPAKAPEPMFSMSEPSVVMLNPSFSAQEALPNARELDEAFGNMLDERPNAEPLVASNPDASVQRVRVATPRVIKPADAPLFAARPQPRAWTPLAPSADAPPPTTPTVPPTPAAPVSRARAMTVPESMPSADVPAPVVALSPATRYRAHTAPESMFAADAATPLMIRAAAPTAPAPVAATPARAPAQRATLTPPAQASRGRAQTAPESMFGIDVPDAIPFDEDEDRDEPQTTEYGSGLATRDRFSTDESTRSTKLNAAEIIRSAQQSRTATLALTPQVDASAAPPVGRVPPRADDAARSVMRPPTVQPPHGPAAEPYHAAQYVVSRSVPPSSGANDAPPVGVVPQERASAYGAPGQRAPVASAAHDAIRGPTHPGVGTPMRGPTYPGPHNVLRAPTNPGVSHLRGPSGPHAVLTTPQPLDDNRPPPVGIVPADITGGHRARNLTARPLRAPTPAAGTSAAADVSGRNRALVLNAPGAIGATPESIPTGFPRAHPPVRLLTPTHPISPAQGARGFFSQHRSAVVLGVSIVIAALIFTVGQVYVAQSPPPGADPTPRTHIRAEPTDATRLSLAAAVQQCVVRPYPAAATSVRFTVLYEGASGAAQEVHIASPFSHNLSTRCIEHVARATTVPPFASTDDDVSYDIPLY